MGPLVQGNIDQNLKWNAHYQMETIEICRPMQCNPRSGLIVWPETATPFYLQGLSGAQQAIIDIAISFVLGTSFWDSKL